VGGYLLARLKDIQKRHPNMGDVRGKGLMVGIELVADPETKRPFDLAENFGARIWDRCVAKDILIRNLADTFIISPPLTFTTEHADKIADTFDEAISAVE
jgi:4-aminobutyrate aminotransferase-like enzyme